MPWPTSAALPALLGRNCPVFKLLPVILLAACAGPVEVRLGPEVLDLGSVPVGGAALGRVELMLVSSGPAGLSLSVEPDDSGFRVLDGPVGGLSQGDHHFVHVEFAPTSAGEQVAALVFEIDAGHARRRIDLELRGTAVAVRLDRDRDGWVRGPDCDDDDASVHPGAAESCDGRDEDCDGFIGADEADADADGLAICEGDCDDLDASIRPGAAEVCDGSDSDCDGDLPSEELDLDHDTFPPCAGDCADLDPDRNPAQPEFCDGLDTDCDGVLFPEELDGDSDGALPCEGDCADEDPDRGPGFPELCNGLDDDCDGAVPPDEVDLDGDGFVGCDSDCDDSNPAIHVDMDEVCNGVDDDCDGALMAGEVDGDGDGFLACEECDDGDAGRFPGGVELCDGLDGDCDGAPGAGEVDQDGDGYLACSECDDANVDVFPGAPELCDGVDGDCDGLPGPGEHDLDADGFLACDDCDDGNPDTNPGASEICDRLDNDCDGGLPSDEQDGDVDGTTECEGDCDDADATRSPAAAEECFDEIDQDCDGLVNDGCSCPAWVAPTAPPTCVTSGTWQCPHTTVQAAVDALEFDPCGDVWIQPGTYVENLIVSAATDLVGQGLREDIVLDGAGVDTVVFGQAPLLHLERLTLTGGVGNGGGVESVGASTELEDVLLIDNACSLQGESAGVLVAGDLDVRDSAFLDNPCLSSAGRGGAIRSTAGAVSVDGSVFDGNRALYGAAISVAGGVGPVAITRNVFTDNEALPPAPEQGGGVGGTVRIVGDAYISNNLFGGNVGLSEPGALLLIEPTAATVVANNVFVANTAGSGGAIHLSLSGPPLGTFQNNIVAGNAPFGMYVDGSGFSGQTRFNDVWDNVTDWGSSSVVFVPPDNISVAPGFVAWSDDGDFSNDDFVLDASSPVVDAGNPAPAWADPDGSANDMGLFGGPFGDWAGP